MTLIGGEPPLDKLGHKQTKDRIADMLRKEILSGRIESGSELAQEQLAEVLEVSRMPVREALQILEMEGLLLRLPNRHMRVVGLDEQALYQTMRVVAAVETELALLFIEHDSLPEEFDPLDNHQFHHRFSKQLQNPYLRQMHRRLLNIYPQHVWDTDKDNPQLIQHNETILRALFNRDADAVRAHIQAYYHTLADLLISNTKEKNHE